MQILLSHNEAIAAERTVALDDGLSTYEALPMFHSVLAASQEQEEQKISPEIEKLTKAIYAKDIYNTVTELRKKLIEKAERVEHYKQEIQKLKEEVLQLERAPLIDRIKKFGSKTILEEKQNYLNTVTASYEKLEYSVARIQKDILKYEQKLPFPYKEIQAILTNPDAAIKKQLQQQTKEEWINSKNIVACSVHEAMAQYHFLQDKFDIVCVDDAETVPLPIITLLLSLGRERCIVIGNPKEQIPRSASLLEPARLWLRNNIFSYYQEEYLQQKNILRNLPKECISVIDDYKELLIKESFLFDKVFFEKEQTININAITAASIYYINTDYEKTVTAQYVGRTKMLPFNEISVKKVIECVKHAIMVGQCSQEDILIIVPQTGQSIYIKDVLRMHRFDNVEVAILGYVSHINKKVVIFDTVLAGVDYTLRPIDDKKIGADEVVRLLITLLGIPEKTLYIITNLEHFKTLYKKRVITQLLEKISTQAQIDSSIFKAAQKFDNLPLAIQKKVMDTPTHLRTQPDFVQLMEKYVPKSKDTQPTTTGQTIAHLEQKLKKEITTLTPRVIGKRESINFIAQYLNESPVFPVTIATQKNIQLLLDVDCASEEQFSFVVDFWNEILCRPIVSFLNTHRLASKVKNESGVIGELTQIHSYYFPTGEVTPDEIKAILFPVIQKLYQECIEVKPTLPTDWMSLYIAFLNKIDKYLDSLINQIRM